jgi:hypothetical protein
MAPINHFVASYRNRSESMSVRTVVIDSDADSNSNEYIDAAARSVREQKLKEEELRAAFPCIVSKVENGIKNSVDR